MFIYYIIVYTALKFLVTSAINLNFTCLWRPLNDNNSFWIKYSLTSTC